MQAQGKLPLLVALPDHLNQSSLNYRSIQNKIQPQNSLAIRFANKSHYDQLCDLFLTVLQDQGIESSLLQKVETTLRLTESQNLSKSANYTSANSDGSINGALHTKVPIPPCNNPISQIICLFDNIIQTSFLRRSGDLSSLISTFEYAMNRRCTLSERKNFLLRLLRKKTSFEKPIPSQVRSTPESVGNRFHRLFPRKMRCQLDTPQQEREREVGLNIQELLSQARSQKLTSASDIVLHFKHMKTCFGHGNEQEGQELCPHIFNVVFQKSGKMMISGDEEGLIKIWSARTGLLLRSLRGHTSYIEALHVSSSNKYLISCGNDGIRIWSLQHFTCLCVLQTDKPIIQTGSFQHPDTSTQLLCFSDSEYLYVISEQEFIHRGGKKLEFDSISRKQKINKAIKDNNLVTSMAVSETGFLLLGLQSGQIILFHRDIFIADLSTRQNTVLASVISMNEHSNKIIEFSWNKQTNYFLSTAMDGSCRLWHFTDKTFSEGVLKSTEILRSPKCHKRGRKRGVYCHNPRWSADDKYFVVAFSETRSNEDMDYGEGDIFVYDLLGGRVLHQVRSKLKYDIKQISFLETHPTFPNIALFAELTGKIVIFDIIRCQILNIFQERAFHLNHPTATMEPLDGCFSPDGNLFAVSSELGSVSIYGYGLRDFYMGCPAEQFFGVDHEQFELDENLIPCSLYNRADINLQAQTTVCNLRGEPYDFKYSNPLGELSSKGYFQMARQCADLHPVYAPEPAFFKTFFQQQDEQAKIEELFNTNHQVMQAITDSQLLTQQQTMTEELKTYLKNKLMELNQLTENQPAFQANTLSPSLPLGPPTRSNNKEQDSDQKLEENHPSGSYERQTRNSRGTAAPVVRRFRRMDSSDQDADSSEPQFNQQGGESDEEEDSEAEWEEQQEQQESEFSAVIRARRRRGRVNRDDEDGEPAPQRNSSNPYRRRPEVEIQALEEEYNEHLRNYARRRHMYSEDSEDVNRVSPGARQHNSTANAGISGLCLRCSMEEAELRCKCGKQYCSGCSGVRGKGQPFKCFECSFKNNNSQEQRANCRKDFWSQESRDQDKYVPQIGDQVYFFFQGYEETLIKSIDSLNKKAVTKILSAKGESGFILIPLDERKQLRNTPLCTIKAIDFMFPLKERVADRVQSGRIDKGKGLIALLTLEIVETEETLRILYVPESEYLVRKDMYQFVVSNDINNTGVRVNSIVKTSEGDYQVNQKEPYEKNVPDSLWKTLTVSHANEMRRRNRNSETKINVWKIQSLIQNVEPTEYISQETIDTLIENIKRLKATKRDLFFYFDQDVDTRRYKDYNECVELPMSVHKIEERLRNHYYCSVEMLRFDINLIAKNSQVYNGEQSEITFMAVTLASELLRLVDTKTLIQVSEPGRIDMEVRESIAQNEEPEVQKENQSRTRARRGRPRGTTRQNMLARQTERAERSNIYEVVERVLNVGSENSDSQSRVRRNVRVRYNESSGDQRVQDSNRRTTSRTRAAVMSRVESEASNTRVVHNNTQVSRRSTRRAISQEQ